MTAFKDFVRFQESAVLMVPVINLACMICAIPLPSIE